MRNRRQITVRSLVFGLIFLAGWILIGFPALSMEWPNRRRAKVDEPNTPTQLARSIDSVEEKILDDGVVVIKEPDVWGQARMTMYRRDIERVLRSALDDTKYFDFIVSARIARVDEASFKSQTALGASLTPLAGGRSGGSSSATTASSAPTVIALPNPTAVMNERDAQMKTANQLLDQADTDGIVRSSPFAYLPSKAPFSNVGQQPGQLGIEPSIFLDEKKRFLDHLNQLRRVNLGDDNSDSAGYGIYLLRMPVSIQPGECTLKGHGAILTATIHHGFGPDFLKETIKNLIINDVVDQISPIVYELIRTGLIEKLDSDFAKRESDRRRFAELKFDAGRKKLDERLMEKQNKKNEYDLKLITLKNQYASIITEAHGKIKFSMQSWFKKEKIDNINIQVVDEMRIAEMLNKSIKDPNFKNDILEVRKIKSQLQAIKRNKEKLIEAVDKLTGSGNFGPNPPVPFVKSLNSDISEIDSTLKRFSENEKLLKSGETLTSIVDKTAKMIPSNLETTIPIVTDLDQLSILNSTGLETYKDIPIDIKKRFSFQLMNDVISGWNSNTAVNDLKKDLSDQLKMLNITNLNSIIDSITNEYKSNIELSIMSSTNLKSQSETTPQRIDSISYLDSITNMIVEILNSLSLNDEKEQCIKNVLIEVNMDKNTINGIIKDIRKTSEDLKKMNNDIYIVKKEIDKLEKSISDSNNKIQEKLSSDLREISQNIADLEKNISLERMANVAFPLTRYGVRSYPVAPSDFDGVFIKSILIELARHTRHAISTKIPKATEVRNYIHHEVESAFDLLPYYESYVAPIHQLIKDRKFDELRDSIYPKLTISLPGDIRGQTLQALPILCWCVAVEAGLLDEQIKKDMKNTIGRRGFHCADPDSLIFYSSVTDPETEATFQRYVKARWPMITFALDPFVDQQNLDDASSTRRDLQLALAYAFAAGRINMNQLDKFNRHLELDAETIALNRTVTSFAHGNETFGWRFSPRYQNPPQEKTNAHVLANLLISGGPGRNYQIKNSKLEAGQRELTAVVIMPSILQRVKVETTGNWFPLHDPDQMKVPTARMLEQGRKVVALRQALSTTRDCGHYREEDLERLETRIDQIEAILPMQTRHVMVPYENTLGGFQLFNQGATALVPELFGFEGIDQIDPEKGADIMVFGKHISIHETKVVVGGKYLSVEDAPVPSQTSSNPSLTSKVSVEIISREVIHLVIPPGAATSWIRNTSIEALNKSMPPTPYLEVYLATPNGISNRLLIPVKHSAPSQSPVANLGDAKYTLLDDSILITAGIVPMADGKSFQVTKIEIGEGSKIRIRPDSDPGADDSTIRADFRFRIDGNIMIRTIVDKIPFQDDAFIIEQEKLKQFADDLVNTLNDNGKLMTLGNPFGVRTNRILITVDGGDGAAAKTINPLKVRFELFLDRKPSMTSKPSNIGTSTTPVIPSKTNESGTSRTNQSKPSATESEASSTENHTVDP